MKFPPLILRLCMRGRGLPSFNLWLPLFLLWPICLAFLIVLSPLILLSLVVAFFIFSIRLNVFELFAEFYEILCALRGLSVEVQEQKDEKRIQIQFQ